MKIQTSVRNIYDDIRPSYENLQRLVEPKLRAKLKKGWFFEDRIKSVVSYALKLETGRVQDAYSLEDFYACTLVVKDHQALLDAEEIIVSLFPLEERRPESSSETKNWPTNFPFDDLRLIVHWQDDPDRRPTGVDGYYFEVQIKTFLQHAWSIATHDSIYKADSVNWGKERLASQLRAMLNHAELALQEASALSDSDVLKFTHSEYDRKNEMIAFLKERWEPEALPDDLKRLSESILDVLSAIGLSNEELQDDLETQTAVGRGYKLRNLSPYSAVVQTIVDVHPEKLLKFAKKQRSRSKVVIMPEVEFELKSDIAESSTVIVVQYL